MRAQQRQAVTIRRLPAAELERIGEVDRSEDSSLIYTQDQTVIRARPASWRIPRWSDDPRDGFSMQVQLSHWAPILENGGTLFGALEGTRLVGFAILRPELSPGTAELAALFVDRSHRRSGIATALLQAVEEAARQSGAANLYVSSVPSEAAVGFYWNQGFRPAASANAELMRRKPMDIHLVKQFD